MDASTQPAAQSLNTLVSWWAQSARSSYNPAKNQSNPSSHMVDAGLDAARIRHGGDLDIEEIWEELRPVLEEPVISPYDDLDLRPFIDGLEASWYTPVNSFLKYVLRELLTRAGVSRTLVAVMGEHIIDSLKPDLTVGSGTIDEIVEHALVELKAPATRYWGEQVDAADFFREVTPEAARKVANQVATYSGLCTERLCLVVSPPYELRLVKWIDEGEYLFSQEFGLGGATPASPLAEDWERMAKVLVIFCLEILVQELGEDLFKGAGKKLKEKYSVLADKTTFLAVAGERKLIVWGTALNWGLWLSSCVLGLFWEFVFSLLGPHVAFWFISDIANPYFNSPSQLDPVLRSTQRLTLPLKHCRQVNVTHSISITTISPSLGIVIKYFLDEIIHDKELKCYRDLEGIPHIPSLIAIGQQRQHPQSGTLPFIIITYHGSPLSRDLSLSEVAHFYSTIIEPMHKRGWHHHDIKLDNILCDHFGRLVLIDFSLATKECDGIKCPDTEWYESYTKNV